MQTRDTQYCHICDTYPDSTYPDIKLRYDEWVCYYCWDDLNNNYKDFNQEPWN